MEIATEDDFSGVDTDHPWAGEFTVLTYAQGGITTIPHNFFRDWRDLPAAKGDFHIGRCSGLGVGSVAKYDTGQQGLGIGRFVSGGQRLRFVLNGQHDIRTMSSYLFSVAGVGMTHAEMPQYGDSIVKNDVWIGDEMMMLGGGIIENGCVIGARALLPPNFRSEAYGIYAGAPARLVRFRFSEKVRAALLELAWWDLPLSLLQENNALFLHDLTADEGKSLELIAQLRMARQEFERRPPTGTQA